MQIWHWIRYHSVHFPNENTATVSHPDENSSSRNASVHASIEYFYIHSQIPNDGQFPLQILSLLLVSPVKAWSTKNTHLVRVRKIDARCVCVFFFKYRFYFNTLACRGEERVQFDWHKNWKEILSDKQFKSFTGGFSVILHAEVFDSLVPQGTYAHAQALTPTPRNFSEINLDCKLNICVPLI